MQEGIKPIWDVEAQTQFKLSPREAFEVAFPHFYRKYSDPQAILERRFLPLSKNLMEIHRFSIQSLALSPSQPRF